jgi:hypothetical protein
MSLIQKLAIAYFFMFIGVVALDFIPGFKDAEGYLFGLFSLDLYDHSLHLFSGIWALVAGIISRAQAVRYFQWFGLIYFFDGVVGCIFGNAYLDFGIFLYGTTDWSPVVKILASAPHIAIGGTALFIGFYLSRRFN